MSVCSCLGKQILQYLPLARQVKRILLKTWIASDQQMELYLRMVSISPPSMQLHHVCSGSLSQFKSPALPYPYIPVTAQALATKGKSDQVTNKLKINSYKKTCFPLET